MFGVKAFYRQIVFCLCTYSVIHYLNAPQTYSLAHCTQSFTLFVIEAFIVIRERCKFNLLSFELPFTFGFGFVCYAYPMIYYNLDPYFSLFAFDFPEQYITKGTALASVAFSFLVLGCLKCSSLPLQNVNYDSYIGSSKIKLTRITEFLLLIMIVSLIPVALSGVYDMNWGAGGEIRGLLESLIYYTIFQKFYLNRGGTIKTLLRNNKNYFIMVLLYILLSTIIGNRGNIIRIGLLCFVFYNLYIKKVSNVFILTFLSVGMFLMYTVGAIRDSGSYQNARESSVSFWDFGRDLTINNRSEYVLMDIADRKGYTYGENFLGSLLSPIPFAQSTYLNITGKSVENISSGSLVTYDFFSKGDRDLIGLGTNIVGDVYLAFGLIGVIVLFYLLGTTISKISYRANMGSPIMQFVYAILLMNTVIWIRSDFFKPFQMVVWGVALYYIFDRKRIL